MTIRGTLMLAGILSLLVAYLMLTEPPEATHDAPEASRLAPPLGRATRIELTLGGSTLSLDRDQNGWDDVRAVDLLEALAGLRVLAVIDEAPADPVLYGFAADVTRLRVLDGTAALLDLDIGAASPAGTGVYVRRVGQRPVLLVGALLRWELEKIRRARFGAALP